MVMLVTALLITACGNEKKKVYTMDDVAGLWGQMSTTSNVKNGMFMVDSMGFYFTLKKDSSVEWTTKSIVDHTLLSYFTLRGKWDLNDDTIRAVFLTNQNEVSLKIDTLKEPFNWMLCIESIKDDSMTVKVFDNSNKSMIVALAKMK